MKSSKFWDRMAKNYDSGTDKTMGKILEITKKHIQPNDVVLDYGCATGAYSLNFSGIANKIHGIDLSAKMIKIAQEKAIKQNADNINFTHTTIFDEELKKGSFDVVLGLNILHLVDDIDLVINRISKLLKPGGLFVSATVCIGNKKSVLSRSLYFLNKIGLVPDIKMFSTSQLEGKITAENFQITETTEVSQNPVNQYIVAKKNIKLFFRNFTV